MPAPMMTILEWLRLMVGVDINSPRYVDIIPTAHHRSCIPHTLLAYTREGAKGALEALGAGTSRTCVELSAST